MTILILTDELTN